MTRAPELLLSFLTKQVPLQPAGFRGEHCFFGEYGPTPKHPRWEVPSIDGPYPMVGHGPHPIPIQSARGTKSRRAGPRCRCQDEAIRDLHRLPFNHINLTL